MAQEKNSPTACKSLVAQENADKAAIAAATSLSDSTIATARFLYDDMKVALSIDLNALKVVGAVTSLGSAAFTFNNLVTNAGSGNWVAAGGNATDLAAAGAAIVWKKAVPFAAGYGLARAAVDVVRTIAEGCQ